MLCWNLYNCISRMLLLQRSVATWLRNHPLSGSKTRDKETSPSSVNLVSRQDSTMWFIVCTAPHWHYPLRPCAICKDWQHNGPDLSGNGSILTRLNDGDQSLVAGLYDQRWDSCWPQTDCHSSLHWDVVSTGTRIYQIRHIGFLDFRRGGGWLKNSWYTGHSGWYVGWWNIGENRKPRQLCRTQSPRYKPRRAVKLSNRPDWYEQICTRLDSCSTLLPNSRVPVRMYTKGVSPARSCQLGQEVIPGLHFICCLL